MGLFGLFRIAEVMQLPKLREDAAKIIESFITARLDEAGASGVAIGLSGGLDSSVTASLSVRAIGRDRVLGIAMPEEDSDPKDLEHASLLAKSLGIELRVVVIGKALRSIKECIETAPDKLTLANLKARTRMIVLYCLANSENRLVLGCSNKSELMVGYFTKFGDGASDYLPIGDLYKSQVRDLARELDIPDVIIQKTPSAGLWKGQTDEGEMGLSYDMLDSILYGLEMQLSDLEIATRADCDPFMVGEIRSRVHRSIHKRRTPLIPKIGIRTPGYDWREP